MKGDKKFWYRWIVNYSIGELLGIGAAASIGRILFVEFSGTALSQTPFLFFFILVLAGALEGIIIGYIQWRSLSRLVTIPFHPGSWTLVTMCAAIIGWLLVLPPSIVFISFLSSLKLIDNYYSLLYAAIAGFAFGGIIGFAQFFIIGTFYHKAYLWVIANALGWMLSFNIVYAALLLFSYTTYYIANVLVIITACALSGLAQGFITGQTLHFLMPLKK